MKLKDCNIGDRVKIQTPCLSSAVMATVVARRTRGPLGVGTSWSVVRLDHDRFVAACASTHARGRGKARHCLGWYADPLTEVRRYRRAPW